MYLLLAYFDPSPLPASEVPWESLELLGVYSEFSKAHEACRIHAKAFNTNNSKPLDWSMSQAIAQCSSEARYILRSTYLDRMPDYSMRTKLNEY